ncbi:MAG: DUF559 domain-containing protein [Caldilineaceae bacterium]
MQAPTRDAGESPFGWRQDADPATGFKQFATVAELLPPSSVPGLFVLLPEATAYAELRAALTSLTALVEAVPTLPVALALTGAQGQLLWEALPESKVKAMMRSGLIAIPAPEPDALRTWLHSCGVNDEDRLQPLLDLAERHGMTPDLMAAALPLLDSTAQPAAAPGAPFRSHAEWLLFQYLEANPKTVGRFQVNVQLGIDFGTHKMEVDFLDAAAKLVIELDGHYHFTELDNYRRDRRKDRLLQQHGYLVLRFLADDVVSELETIFAAIDQSLWSRQTSS